MSDKIIKPEGLAEVVEIPITEFLNMPPAPGHRDSDGRAFKADHLKVLVPEHIEVDVAEYPEASSGKTIRAKMTGNTRSAVWKAGLSNHVPQFVRARVYRMASEDEVRMRMLRHDAPEAAWSAKDYVNRALDMTYGDSWRPSSKELKGGRYVNAIKTVDAIAKHSRWSHPVKGIRPETIMKDWATELKELDSILDNPKAPSIMERKPFTWGLFAGLLLLLRYRPFESVRRFAVAVLDDQGTKIEGEGSDGIQTLVDYFAKKQRLGSNSNTEQDFANHVIACYEAWESDPPRRAKSIKKADAIEWQSRQRETQKEASSRSRLAG